MDIVKICSPLTDIGNLKAGQLVKLSGEIFTARDAAHKKMTEILKSGRELDFDIDGKIVYYAGPCPEKAGQPIGSVGPTTSGRMDAYAPFLMQHGLKAMIGKGLRNKEVIDSIIKYGGVYFAAIGGAGALIAKCVKSAEVIAFPELGAEAVRRLVVEDLPLIVAIDSTGANAYEFSQRII